MIDKNGASRCAPQRGVSAKVRLMYLMGKLDPDRRLPDVKVNYRECSANVYKTIGFSFSYLSYKIFWYTGGNCTINIST
jgi:hypothetical protein